jgi:hypothetical protein
MYQGMGTGFPIDVSWLGHRMERDHVLTAEVLEAESRSWGRSQKAK